MNTPTGRRLIKGYRMMRLPSESEQDDALVALSRITYDANVEKKL